MEACAARLLGPGRFSRRWQSRFCLSIRALVKPFVTADAEGIYEAPVRPTMRFGAVQIDWNRICIAPSHA